MRPSISALLAMPILAAAAVRHEVTARSLPIPLRSQPSLLGMRSPHHPLPLPLRFQPSLLGMRSPHDPLPLPLRFQPSLLGMNNAYDPLQIPLARIPAYSIPLRTPFTPSQPIPSPPDLGSPTLFYRPPPRLSMPHLHTHESVRCWEAEGEPCGSGALYASDSASADASSPLLSSGGRSRGGVQRRDREGRDPAAGICWGEQDQVLRTTSFCPGALSGVGGLTLMECCGWAYSCGVGVGGLTSVYGTTRYESRKSHVDP